MKSETGGGGAKENSTRLLNGGRSTIEPANCIKKDMPVAMRKNESGMSLMGGLDGGERKLDGPRKKGVS